MSVEERSKSEPIVVVDEMEEREKRTMRTTTLFLDHSSLNKGHYIMLDALRLPLYCSMC